MKYLGLYLDSRWEFGEHFGRTVPKMLGVAAALSWLLPNLGKPVGRVRRLYVNINLVALYDVPIWVDAALSSRCIKVLMRRTHRIIALRAARAYRTVAYAAATVLGSSA